MKQISDSKFKEVFPTLQKVYNDSKGIVKLWQKTVGKSYIVDDWESEVRRYWNSRGITK